MFTSVMLFSGVRGKQISQKIFDKQTEMLKNEGVQGEALAVKTAKLVEKEIMIKPNWHKMRLMYLGTAMASFAFGTFFKRKEEKPEDLERYSQMSLPAYMVERTKEALNPTEHSRQTVGVLSFAAGVLAIRSAITQPGGIHKSERFAGFMLAAGGFFLAYIKNAALAQQAFTAFWLARTPAIITGTKESILDAPMFKNPMIQEMKKSDEFFAGVKKAYTEGHPEKVFFNAFTKQRTGGQAMSAYDASYGKLAMPFKRMDAAYPVGQIGNLYSALLGIAGKKLAPKHAAKVEPVAAPVSILDDRTKAVSPVVFHHDASHAEIAAVEQTRPSTKVGHVEAHHERVDAKELATQMSA
jgi:hypothetical protein